ncbi:predicted protein [Uncinocarpus reesii 1704]|uniref:Uncharacterized protein n=1 Tax=Uncinocarpus reesii (strain UAMH 1704) TaxID=336963 RepID=C4JNL9_UNCRE|nr:uncharacterized protein UREG_03017 [Uncinocarpus reesii 1704]EEP78172.1 predicted protein [Uncinocarpus reesii 1704]
MAVGTTQANGGTAAEVTQTATETRWRPSSPSAPRYASETSAQQQPPPPLRSSRQRSLGVHDEQGAAVAAAASAYCTKETAPRKVIERPSVEEHQPPFVLEAAEEGHVTEVDGVGTTEAVDEEYDRTEWNDSELIEDDGLLSALPSNPRPQVEENSEQWAVPPSMSTPAIVTTGESERAAMEHSAIPRGSSPLRHETVIIGNATEIPYIPEEERVAQLTHGQGSAHPAEATPVYSVAVQQAEAERAVLEEHKRHPEELAEEDWERHREAETPRVILACESAILQAEAESCQEPGEELRVAGGISKPERTPEYFRAEQPLKMVPGTREPLQEAEQVDQGRPFRKEEGGKGMVAGIGRLDEREGGARETEHLVKPPEQLHVSAMPPVVMPPEPTTFQEHEAPIDMQQQLHDDAEIRAAPAPVGTAPILAQVEEPTEGTEEFHEAVERPIEERPQAPVQAPAPAAAAVPERPGAAPRKLSRAERRRAEKDAKSREKRRQREEKDRVNEEKRRQMDEVQRRLEEQKSNNGGTEQGPGERRDSKMESGGFFTRLLRRASSKPTDAANVAGQSNGGQQAGTTAAPAMPAPAANQPPVLAS